MNLLEIFTYTTDLETCATGSLMIEPGTQGQSIFVVVESKVGIS